MSQTLLNLYDQLSKKKADLARYSQREKDALEDIKYFLRKQSELQDEIESMEKVIYELRFSDQPKRWFHRSHER